MSGHALVTKDQFVNSGLPFPQFDPIAIPLWGDFGIRWYALAYLAGILLGWAICSWQARRFQNESNIRPNHFADFIGFAAIGIVLGGRLGYVLFYDLSHFLQYPLQILQIWNGGMAFHGGFLGVVVVVWLYSRSEKVPLMRFADFIALAAPVGLFFGRIANFINNELWGRAADLPWAVNFPIPLELQRLYPEVPRHPSQLYEAALEGVVLFLVLFACMQIAAIRNRPGILTGLFMMGYGLARFSVEFFRQFQLERGLFFDWMTYGQLYSIPLILVGAVLVFYFARKPLHKTAA